MTEIVGPDQIVRARELLEAGELVAFPTETVYGLGANALQAEAVAKIFQAKGRPSHNPLIVHVRDQSQARELVTAWPTQAEQLAERFWPGPLTLVLPKQSHVPAAVTASGPTVAVRSPAHPLARQLLEALPFPLAAPSANRSGQLSPTTAQHVAAAELPGLALILDGGPCSGGLESTVLDLSGSTPRLLRPGLISRSALESVIGPIQEGEPTSSEVPLPSPGLMTRHYAPKTALECAETQEELSFLRNLYETAGLRVGIYEYPSTTEEVSRTLYADLHQLDGQGFDRLLTVLPPASVEWQAVRDRLLRASAEE